MHVPQLLSLWRQALIEPVAEYDNVFYLVSLVLSVSHRRPPKHLLFVPPHPSSHSLYLGGCSMDGVALRNSLNAVSASPCPPSSSLIPRIPFCLTLLYHPFHGPHPSHSVNALISVSCFLFLVSSGCVSVCETAPCSLSSIVLSLTSTSCCGRVAVWR